jgi:hypothetical protein
MYEDYIDKNYIEKYESEEKNKEIQYYSAEDILKEL